MTHITNASLIVHNVTQAINLTASVLPTKKASTKTLVAPRRSHQLPKAAVDTVKISCASELHHYRETILLMSQL
jgi:hypothetical protein